MGGVEVGGVQFRGDLVESLLERFTSEDAERFGGMDEGVGWGGLVEGGGESIENFSVPC